MPVAHHSAIWPLVIRRVAVEPVYSHCDLLLSYQVRPAKREHSGVTYTHIHVQYSTVGLRIQACVVRRDYCALKFYARTLEICSYYQ